MKIGNKEMFKNLIKDMDLKEVNSEKLYDLAAEMGWAKGGDFILYCKEQGVNVSRKEFVEYNSKNKIEKRVTYMSDEMFNMIYDSLKKTDKNDLFAACLLGCAYYNVGNLQEVSELTIDDIDTKEGTITIRKENGEDRVWKTNKMVREDFLGDLIKLSQVRTLSRSDNDNLYSLSLNVDGKHIFNVTAESDRRRNVSNRFSRCCSVAVGGMTYKDVMKLGLSNYVIMRSEEDSVDVKKEIKNSSKT